MKKKLCFWVTGLSLWLVAPLVLAEQIQCPNSTKFVSIGDPINRVVLQCGQPKRIVKANENVSLWGYSLMSVGTIVVGYRFLFKNNRVVEITSNRVQRPFLRCQRGVVRIGSTTQQVRVACGQPSIIRNLSAQAKQIRGEITHLIYQPQTYLPKTIFIFRNGQLIGSQ